jgi:ribonuclease E
MPKVQPYSLPLEELAQLAQGSGLSWVSSNAEKVAAAQADMAAQPEPVRVVRERPAPVVMDVRPLVLVETRRDLRNVTLPFEQTETL